MDRKIYYLIKNIKNFIPDNPTAQLLHGDLWEGNIIFNNKNFVGFIDPGSFYGHNEMEVAYLRWFNPDFVDSNFLQKYNVRRGQKVKKGDIIGFVGSTGRSQAPHLHYEVHKDKKRVNPINFYLGNLTPDEFDDLLKLANQENQSLD